MALVVPTLLALEQLPTLRLTPLVEVNLETLRSALKALKREKKHSRTVEELKKHVERDERIMTLDIGEERTPTERYLRIFNLCLRVPEQEPADKFDENFFESLQICMEEMKYSLRTARDRYDTVEEDCDALVKIIDLLQMDVTREEFYAEMKLLRIKIPQELGENVK